MPIKSSQINYKPQGKDRSGWLFQQLLKLTADIVCTQEQYLVIDADTVFIRPVVFEKNSKTILYFSDEHHLPYFKAYKKMIGLSPLSPFSFVAHHMLIDRKKTAELKKRLEKKSKQLWYQSIINQINTNETSGFSEFETYGNFLLRFYPKKIYLNYWFNLSLPREDLVNINNLEKQYSPKYISISFHAHNK